MFELEEEYLALQKVVRDFAENEVKPVIDEFEKKEKFPRSLVKKLGELGLMGVAIPVKYGGAGMNTFAYAIAQEELARVWASLALIMSANNSLTCAPIYEFGTDEQKKRYLTPLAKGKKLGCYALTEPDAGSDVVGIKASAKYKDVWVINGTKQFITNASEADICVVIVRTGSDPHRDLTAFILDTYISGFDATRIEKKMGLHSSPACQIVLEDYRAQSEDLLGGISDGWKIAMQTLNGGRINIAAQSVGIAQGAFEEALAYAKTREMFSARLIDLQDCRFKLAKMEANIEAARLLTWKAAWMKDDGKDIRVAAAQAKWFASEMAQRVTYDAVQMFGGLGYMRGTPVERFFRDARALTIYEGASEIQLEVLSRRYAK